MAYIYEHDEFCTENLFNQISGYYLGLKIYLARPKEGYKKVLEERKERITNGYETLRPLLEQELKKLGYRVELLTETIEQIKEMDLEKILKSERKEELKEEFRNKEKLYSFIYQQLRDGKPDNPNVWY